MPLLEVISWAMPLVLAFLFIIFIVFGLVLSYHWRRYGAGAKLVKRLHFSYFIIGGVLLGIMIVAQGLFFI